MKVDLSGKVAVVTGGANGNGAAIARGLADAGARVAVCDIDSGATGTEGSGGEADRRLLRVTLDVTKPEDCERAAARIASELGDTAILVNNAGIIRRGAMDDPAARENWRATIDVNVNGPFNVTMAFLAQLRKTKGTIINVASTQSFVATTDAVSYPTSKGAVAQFTKSLAQELAPSGIRVNAIAPGIIRTRMTAIVRNDNARIEQSLKHIPLQRVGEPEELIGPVLFLASGMGSYVTGVVLPVDGGYLIS